MIPTGPQSPNHAHLVLQLHAELHKATPNSVGQLWVLIEQNWVDKFDQYATNNGPHPGPVAFKSLIAPTEINGEAQNVIRTKNIRSKYPNAEENDLMASDQAKEGVDFCLVEFESTFKALVNVFGCDEGSPVLRKVRQENCHPYRFLVDLSLLLVTCLVISPKRRHFQLSLSRYDNFSDLWQKCLNLFSLQNLKPEELRLQVRSQSGSKIYENLPITDDLLCKMVDDTLLENKCILLIDILGVHGWSYDQLTENLNSTSNDDSSLFGRLSSSALKFLDFIGFSKICYNNYNNSNNNNGAQNLIGGSDEMEANMSDIGNGILVNGRKEHSEKHPLLCGLINLGNTCYMNSALQLLLSVRPFCEHFINETFIYEINKDNPLGSKGALANEFNSLLVKITQQPPTSDPAVSAKSLKSQVGYQFPQFRDYSQHDSQEFLMFFLDGLHEDLNRVRNKPYYEEGVPEIINGIQQSLKKIAEESWKRHIARNNSIVVDLFHGLLKSQVTCPNTACKKVSTTFDPYMCLSLPVPSFQSEISTNVYFMHVEFVNGLQVNQIELYKFKLKVNQINIRNNISKALGINVKDLDYFVFNPQNGRLTLLLADNRNFFEFSSIFIFNKPSSSDLMNPLKASAIIIDNGISIHNTLSPHQTARSLIPFVCYLPGGRKFKQSEFMEAIYPYISFLNPNFVQSFDQLLGEKLAIFVKDIKAIPHSFTSENPMKFDDKSPVSLRWTVPATANLQGMFSTVENFQFKSLEVDQIKAINNLNKPGANSISIYDCLDLFLTEEQLLREDSWFCPKCREDVNAFKKIDIWKCPKFLIVHFKRFRFNAINRGKIDTYIEFPIKNLDLSQHIHDRPDEASYNLIGIVNHYGMLGGGHYTATVFNEIEQRWFNCNDSLISPIKTLNKENAYICIYKRAN